MRKAYKPITPGTRHQVRIVMDSRDTGVQFVPKSLISGKPSSGGRNNHGRIVSYHRGGGAKRKYRELSYDWSSLVVYGIQYDPNRSSNIAIGLDNNGIERYVLAGDGVSVGDVLKRGVNIPLVEGNVTTRSSIVIGTNVYNIQLIPGSTFSIARAAGAYSTVVSKSNGYVVRRMPSGKLRRFIPECIATIGKVGGIDHFIEVVGKAGRNRNWGWRSIVRGVAMNPIDHPHGGRTKGGRPDVTPWAWPTKGQPTRIKRKNSYYIV
jgi:large subunit ribosomal protein L2